jgi:tRNA(Arg) A34 adenosine deaminase TadA
MTLRSQPWRPDPLQPSVESLFRTAGQFADDQVRGSNSGSAHEYFSVLLKRAVRAGLRRDYGIAAAVVAPTLDTTIVSFGTNTVFSAADPTGHAEVNALRSLQRALRSMNRPDNKSLPLWRSAREVADSSSATFLRADSVAPPSQPLLYTTLEPCPMCTVAILNAGINTVVIATPDPRGGSLTLERLRGLPPLWQEMAAAHGVRALFVDPDDPDNHDTYVPPELAQHLGEVFAASSPPLDQWLANGGLLRDRGQRG